VLPRGADVEGLLAAQIDFKRVSTLLLG